MNISHSRFILFKLKIFGEIVTTFTYIRNGTINFTFAGKSSQRKSLKTQIWFGKQITNQLHQLQ